MNRYILIRRLMGPAILLLIGVTALLHQMGVIDHWARMFWPLLLILIGVIKLAERAALAADGYPTYPGTTGQGYPNGSYPGAQYPGSYPGSYPGAAGQQQAQAPVSETSIVPRDDGSRNGGVL